MLRSFIVDILFPLLLFALLRSFVRGFFQSKRNVSRDAPPVAARPNLVTGGELKKDPVCGVYILTRASVTRTVDGQVVHFCSTECRDKYRAG
jgi:YHS domain-containing protein